MSWAGSAPAVPASPGTDPAGPVSLEGDWYVLVHYRDEGSDDGQQYWDDEIWRFARRGGRLSWSLHPHVSLRDTTGRTETLPSGEEARTVGAWSPSPAQLEEIRSALELDGHESRAKSLRGSPESGWRSTGALRSQSASMIAYHESWSIEAPRDKPVFARVDTMGSARTDTAEGRTAFETSEVLDGGNELRGVYERDGRLRGRFRMIRIAVGGASAR